MTDAALLGMIPVQEETEAYFEQRPERQRGLVDCRPLQGLVHLHIVPSVLGLPPAPPRHPRRARCAAVFVAL